MKIQGFYYVADTPYLFSKSLDRTYFIYCALHVERTQTPLKIL